ncbi:Eukaryotic-type DNA primase catalytic small subunit PRI1 [Methanonatronarchaeum thermophilum]|uniref:DNA primase small subunit PriS n=1 Tax=Methanonatronarchaeum thermophilum TaxID=1927129 RepID=A0A1Y3GH32_9EURY|nr:DNA primase catalytic subunit PriS [Methanonatronarchaeum thermophilum]OUJ18745.1 Eukaryotic-type DNA primase catalytic small subunit PRI1 [Methanonatronarchaeum thermophilum]
MRIRTKKYLKENFKKYYTNPNLHIPPQQKNREWGFIHFDKRYPKEISMKRHRAFNNQQEIKQYLQTTAPAHTYYSSAIYKTPNATTMDKKQWEGADLIFDLDADYIANPKQTYKEMLHEVKKEADKLINQFLINDLGFNPKKIQLVFSGGRGYHIHVYDKKIKTLGSNERREIIDYISGKGLSPIKEGSDIQDEVVIEYLKLKKHGNNWDKKITNWIYQELPKKLQNKTKENAIKYLKQLNGVGEKKAERLYKFFTDPERVQRARKTKNLDMVRGVKKDVWTQIIDIAIKKHSVNADEPVTSDIKRLIRLPGSLHGGTGLQVKPIDKQKINEFEPLNDAVIFNDQPVKIKPKKDYQITIKNKKTQITKDTIQEIPKHTAIFLAGRGIAEVEGW